MRAPEVALILVLGLLAAISLHGCRAAAPDVTGIFHEVPDLPDDFTEGLKHAIDHRRGLWGADWSMDTLEMRSVQHLGQYRWLHAPKHETAYLVLVTVKDEGFLPVLALITERPDLENPSRFMARMAWKLRTDHQSGNPIMLFGGSSKLGTQAHLAALGGWAKCSDVATFTIEFTNGRELLLDGQEHQFFAASKVFSSHATLAWREVTAYDGEGNVLWQHSVAPGPGTRWGLVLAGVLVAAALVALALFRERRPRRQEVKRMPDSAFFEDRTHSMGYRYAIVPVVGMLVFLAGGLWGTVVTWPVEVGADMEQVALQELQEVESVERIFAVRGGGVTVNVVGRNEGGALVTERLVINPQTLELVSRRNVLVGRDPYTFSVVTSWVSRLIVITSIVALIRHQAARRSSRPAD